MAINSIGFGCGYCSQAQGFLQLTGVSQEDAKKQVQNCVKHRQEASDGQLDHEQAAKIERDQMRNIYLMQSDMPQYK